MPIVVGEGASKRDAVPTRCDRAGRVDALRFPKVAAIIMGIRARRPFALHAGVVGSRTARSVGNSALVVRGGRAARVEVGSYGRSGPLMEVGPARPTRTGSREALCEPSACFHKPRAQYREVVATRIAGAVEEERRSAGHAARSATRDVVLDQPDNRLVVHVAPEGTHVDTDVRARR